MKLRFYLRGLGIGIVVTALVMGISNRDAGTLTDAEIKAKAATLGMVESDSLKLSDVASEPKDADNPGQPAEAENSNQNSAGADHVSSDPSAEPIGEQTPAGTSAAAPTTEPTATPTTSPAATPTTSPTATPTTAPTATPTTEPTATPTTEPTASPTTSPTASPAQAADAVSITVRSGSGSDTVCRQLEEAGLIENAADFDRYLIDNGYSTRIGVGTYEISKGTSEEEIAKIITKSR